MYKIQIVFLTLKFKMLLILIFQKGGTSLKTCIVLEGGGKRGIYVAGVLDVLHEHGVDCDVIEHFYEVEERHNKRLTKLVQGED